VEKANGNAYPRKCSKHCFFPRCRQRMSGGSEGVPGAHWKLSWRGGGGKGIMKGDRSREYLTRRAKNDGGRNRRI